MPRPNVAIQLCSIEASWAVPLSHPDNADFAADLKAWNAVSDHLYVWDYIVDFANFVMPWPNWDVLVDNLLFFRDNGVVGIFEECEM